MPTALRTMVVPVAIGTVTERTVPEQVHVIGSGEAFNTVTVKSQVDGVIQQVDFRQGQDVRQGDVLFSIDPRPFQAALHQAEANLARDRAQAENAKAQADRQTALFQGGIVSKDQYETFRSTADATAAAVRADEAAVENARLQLGYCTIRSPIDGRTGSLMVDAGNLIKNNDTALVTLNQISPIYVDFSVPQQYLAEIKQFQARGPLRVEAEIPQQNGPPEWGTLTFINNTIDTSTGTILLKGTFPNAQKRLWPGQFVNVTLTLSELPHAVVAPSEAVQTGLKGPYVFVVQPDMTVQLRQVSVGSTFQGVTVIANGLKPGETVVTDGQLNLAPGAKVKVKGQ